MNSVIEERFKRFHTFYYSVSKFKLFSSVTLLYDTFSYTPSTQPKLKSLFTESVSKGFMI